MIRAIRSDLYKNIVNFRFLIGCIGIVILMLSTNCVVDTEDVMPAYTYIQFLFKTDSAVRLGSILYCDIFMFLRCFNNAWLAIFLPLLTCVSCVPAFCDEINSNNFRINISRTGFRKYIFSKCICGILTAAFMMLCACLIFWIFCKACFYSTDYFFAHTPIDDEEMLDYYNRKVSENTGFSSLLPRFMTLILYSAMPCAVTMIAGAATLNKFISLSLPVLLYFGLSEIAIYYEQKAFTSDTKEPLICFFDVRSRLYDGETLFPQTIGMSAAVFYIYPCVMIIILSVVFCRVLKGRVRV